MAAPLSHRKQELSQAYLNQLNSFAYTAVIMLQADLLDNTIPQKERESLINHLSQVNIIIEKIDNKLNEIPF